MARLSARQIAQHAAGAGFTGRGLTIAVAVAMAESGGNPNARALTSREDSRGLWQINTKAHGGGAELYDPATNARKAFQISNGGKNWRPWSAFTNGRYLVFMGAAAAAAGRTQPAGLGPIPLPIPGPSVWDLLPGPGGTSSIPLPGDMGLGDIAGLFKAIVAGYVKAAAWIANPENWLRVVKVTTGILLFVGGLVMVAAPRIMRVLPSGRAVKQVRRLVAA